MNRTVTQVDDLVKVKNVIIYVTDYSKLDFFISGLLKHCPRANIFAPVASFSIINDLVRNHEVSGHLYGFDQLVLEHNISRTLVEPLHSNLFLGILSKTYCAPHQRLVKEARATPIDLVIMNFGLLTSPEGSNDFESVTTRIDVSGQAILSAAITNAARVATVCDPDDYQALIEELEMFEGHTCCDSRLQWAGKGAEYNQIYAEEVRAYFNSLNRVSAIECYKVSNTVQEFLKAKKAKEAKKVKKAKKEKVL